MKPFHFDLTETLFFHRNEGVSEVLGIGLDPEILIESHDDHVSVRGIIALTGEYLPVFIDDQSEVEDDEEIQSRYFKRVEQDEEGVCEFLHHFPIDISIPHERIKSLNDLTVSVDHFDYHVPDARKLELEATIQIEGLEYERKGEDKVEDEVEEEELEQNTDVDTEVEESEEERIQFDIKVKEENEIVNKAEEAEDKVIPLNKREEREELEDDEPISDRVEESIAIHETKTDEIEESVQKPTYLLDLFEQAEDEVERYSKLRMYIVQDEDSLEQIAEKYQVSLAKLQRANRLETTSIYQGQIIYLPQ